MSAELSLLCRVVEDECHFHDSLSLYIDLHTCTTPATVISRRILKNLNQN